MANAILVQSAKALIGEKAIAEIVIWRLPEPLRGSKHHFKYRLALIVDDICVLRYDNEAGKGDHRHVGDQQFGYDFVGVDVLRRDFLLEARRWLEGHSDD